MSPILERVEFSGILRNKTMDDKLLYNTFPKYCLTKHPFCWLKLLVETLGQYQFGKNQSKLNKSPNILQCQSLSKRVCTYLDTNVIYIPLAPPSLGIVLLFHPNSTSLFLSWNVILSNKKGNLEFQRSIKLFQEQFDNT